MLRAELAREFGDDPSDVTATEVIGNIDAMVYCVESVGVGDEITTDLLLEIHRRLLGGSRLETYGGSYRDVQTWIGGRSAPSGTALAELCGKRLEFLEEGL